MKTKHIKFILIMLFVGVTGILFITNHDNDDIIMGEHDNTSVSTALPEPAEGENSKGSGENTEVKQDEVVSVFVHVCGEVVSPGVYEIGSDKRIIDLIEMAGGFTDKASEDYINLAEVVKDQTKIYIPSVDEVTNEQLVDAGTDNNNNDSVNASKDGDKININKADESELTSLTGIGVSRAKNIISYREEHGAFSRIEDIMNVTGIKEGLFDKIKDHITV